MLNEILGALAAWLADILDPPKKHAPTPRATKPRNVRAPRKNPPKPPNSRVRRVA